MKIGKLRIKNIFSKLSLCDLCHKEVAVTVKINPWTNKRIMLCNKCKTVQF